MTLYLHLVFCLWLAVLAWWIVEHSFAKPEPVACPASSVYTVSLSVGKDVLVLFSRNKEVYNGNCCISCTGQPAFAGW